MKVNYKSSVLGAAWSMVDNSKLVTKVYFPREILPLAPIGAASVDFVLQGLVIVAFMATFRYALLLVPLACRTFFHLSGDFAEEL